MKNYKIWYRVNRLEVGYEDALEADQITEVQKLVLKMSSGDSIGIFDTKLRIVSTISCDEKNPISSFIVTSTDGSDSVKKKYAISELPDLIRNFRDISERPMSNGFELEGSNL